MGIVQGLVEWIPISSEGQLILIAVEVYNLTPETALSLAIWLHFGTLFAVLVKYRDEWIKIINYKDRTQSDLRSLIVYTTIGTAITALPLRLLIFEFIDNKIVSSLVLGIIGVALIFTGILMRSSIEKQGIRVIEDLNKTEKILIGMSQGLSIIPGISRSGTTVSSFLLLKVNKEESFKGSFLISVPAVIGAVGLDILLLIFGNDENYASLSTSGILVAILFAFVVGFASMTVILNFVRNYDFSVIIIGFGLILIVILFASY